MSDPFRDVSGSGEAEASKEALLVKFHAESLLGIMEAESENESSPATNPTAQTAEQSLQPEITEQSILKKPESKKRKTPTTSDNTTKPNSKKRKTPATSIEDGTQKSPVRQSPRIAGKKRTAETVQPSEAEEESPARSSPLTKKSKTAQATGGSDAVTTPPPPNMDLPAESTRTTKPTGKSTELLSSSPVAQPKPSVSTKGKGKARATTPEGDYDDGSDFADQPITRKTKKPKALEEDMKRFEATADAGGMGCAKEKPGFATLSEPWKCANRMCTTGLTWLPRETPTESKAEAYGRKVTSHFFGRNKKQTNTIHAEVWHWYCRKCYQRSAYQANKTKNVTINMLTKMHIEVLRMQIIRLQLWRPEATFTVQLMPKGVARLTQYYKALRKPGTSEDDAIRAVEYVPEIKANGKEKQGKPYELFPITSMEHFDNNFCGEKATYEDLTAICDWVDGLNTNGGVPCDPPIEFLISVEAEGETVVHPTNAPDNYERWVRHCDAEAQDSAEDQDDASASDDETVDAPLSDAEGVKGESDDQDDETANAPLTDAESIEGESDVEDGEEAPATPKTSPKATGFLTLTEKGRLLGTRGKAGIVRGSGLLKDREAEQLKTSSSSQATSSSSVDIKKEQ